MKRLFVALSIRAGEEMLDAMSFLKLRMQREHIKWVDLRSIHLTLKFIGEVDDQLLPAIDIGLKQIHDVKPYSFSLEGLGLFRSLADPRVIYIHVRDKDETNQLSLLINSVLCHAGIESEKKAFTPHLTLGRIKYLQNKSLLEEVLFDFRNHYFQMVYCAEFVLYESILSPQGPTYKALARYPLG
jgi:RNA 2',3'-cyclic 3'-phosphodiesterase